jgi:hypothetical protein
MALASHFSWDKDVLNGSRLGRVRAARDRKRRAVRLSPVLELERRTLLSTFTVTDTLDDANMGSLRWAIGQVDADTNPGTDTIDFAISGTGVQEIEPASPLPAITHAALIDGFSQPGFAGTPLIELSGSQAGAADGLLVTVADATVRGLDINSFAQGAGIHLTGTGATGDWVYGDFLGVDPTGTEAMPNEFGVELDGGASINIVGTNGDGVDDAAEQNLISGNLFAGVWINGQGTDGNVVAGNLIGTDFTGMVAVNNSTQPVYDASLNATFGGGVVIENGASSNRIGTDGASADDAGERNVIAGSNNDGVDLAYSGTNGNIVAGNFIGTNVTGTAALGIDGDGVFIAGGADSNWIGVNPNGGSPADEGNVISGNGYAGMQIYNNSNSNVVAGNKIGTDVTGTLALGNAVNGIEVETQASDTTIGGDTSGAGNVISANGTYGLAVYGSGTLVVGNFIGTDVTGTERLGNGIDGMQVQGPSNTIGGTSAGDRNVISANGYFGIQVQGYGAYDELIEGNYIGTDVTGKIGVGNGQDGVNIVYGPSYCTVGGTVAGAGNLISDNGRIGYGSGIGIGYGTYANLIEGNSIGTDVTGTVALGNQSNGIYETGDADTIGGTTAAAANILAGNAEYGVQIWSASNLVVEGNSIGTDLTGTLNLGNNLGGVDIVYDSSNNLIGGLAAGAGNTIAYNGGNGVTVGSTDYYYYTTVDNGILSNSIYSNSGLGIDLGANGVTLNTPGGLNSGPNNFQNYPVVTNVVTFDGSTYLIGTLNSAPSASFTLQFFANAAPDPSGYGQGKTLVDSVDITTDASGNASFLYSTPTVIPAGQSLSATATDLNNNTSEFSQDVPVVASTTAALAFNESYNTDENATLTVPAPGVLGNDIDLNGDPLTAVLVTSTSHGTVSLQANGSFTYTPKTNFLGTDSFTYYATDATYDSSVATVTIDVNPKTYVVTNTNDSGTGSLRWAITQANLSNTAPADTIKFRIPGTGPFTIQPLTPLPAITHAVFINGYSQPGATPNSLSLADNAVIEIGLDGSVAGGDGLTITAGGSTVKGLAITNFASGILVTSNGGDLIAGDFLGTNPTGKAGGVGDQTGVRIDGALSNVIGGTDVASRNLISGNIQQGVLIDDGSSGNTILGNLIGTDATGQAGLGNGYGIVLTDSPGDTIGGSGRSAGNVLANNGNDGILLDSSLGYGAGSYNTVIESNLIGTDTTGTLGLGNGSAGIDLEQGSSSTVGGTSSKARNVISGNGTGISISTTGTVIQGDVIGTDVTGTKAIGNVGDGILVNNYDTGTEIGGTTSGAGNVISGNGSYGVGDSYGDLTLIQGNLIGTDVSGTQPLGNGSDGLNINSSGDTIGGMTSKAANVISANGGDGIDILGSDTLVVGNLIGTDVTGTKALGNTHDGVGIGVSSFSESSDNSIGGTATGAANTIAFNQGNGVTVGTSTSYFLDTVDNGILSNSIYSNHALGIDLGDDGVTLATPGGPHSGPNDLQNFPVLYSSITYNGRTYVSGMLNSTPNSVFTVQFFVNAAADPSGYGQGQTYLGQATVVTDVNGNGSFQVNFKKVVQGTSSLSATATDLSNDTSEFAADVPIVASAVGLYAASDQYHVDLSTSLVVAAPGVQTNDIAASGSTFSSVVVTGPAHGTLTLNADGSFSYTPKHGFTGTDSFTYDDVKGSTVSNVATVTIAVNPKTYVVTNTNDSGSGSLRQAMLGANLATSAPADTIQFDIPGTGPFTISPLTPLPVLTHATIIDGYSQPGSRANTLAQGDNAVILIQLDGALVQSNQTTDGLAVAGGGSTVKGLDITRFGNGIHLLGSGEDLVTGNIVGIDLTGAAAPNTSDGVFIAGVPANTIGGSSASARNVISNNEAAGIDASNSTSDLVSGNYVGTDVTGTQAEGNGQYYSGGGLEFSASPFATVGGATSGAGNLISGNSGDGIYFDPASGNAVVQGNLIGTDATGTVALGNSGTGLYFTASNLTVGGTTAATRNVISGNHSSGIDLYDENLSPGSSDLVTGNDIGVDSSGAKPLGNDGDGIDLTFMGNITIGGTTAKAGNVISSNGGVGISIFAEEGPQLIVGNEIGTDKSGTIALGNGSDGVYIYDATDVTVGGTTASARNIISANGGDGVDAYFVSGGASSGDVVEGNSIGTDATGKVALGNALDGVLLGNFTSGVLVGGTASGSGNVIAYNAGAGVAVVSYPYFPNDNTVDDGILSNSIYGNGALGIDLGGDGVTLNHPGGPITGPNYLQNFPVLGSAVATAKQTTITGTLNSAASTQYLIQFFANTTADPSGYGQGQTLLGSITVTTDVNGNASFTATFKGSLAAGEFISATATDPSDNTSEFALDVSVSSGNAAAAVHAVSPAVTGEAALSIAPVARTSVSVVTSTPLTQSPMSESELEVLAVELIRLRNRRLTGIAGTKTQPLAV